MNDGPDSIEALKPRPRNRNAVRMILVITAVAAAVGYAVRHHNQQKLDELRRSVGSSLASRHFDEARERLDRWSSVRPSDGEPEYLRARIFVMEDRPVEALESLRRAIALGYPEEPAYQLRAVLQARAGQFDVAEPILRRAFEVSAEPRAEVAEGMARIFLETYRLSEAAHALERWMEAAPADPRPYLWRNKIDERLGAEPTVLIHNLREALERDPNLDEARLGLAEVLLKSHRVEEGEEEFAAFLARNPKSVAGNDGAGQVALLKGDLTTATQHFKTALSVDPGDAVALRELGLISLRVGDHAEAIAFLKKAVDVLPFDIEVRYTYARALKATGNDKASTEQNTIAQRLRDEQTHLDELRQALVQRPDDVELRYEAASWLLEHGHEKEALEWTSLILQRSPEHPRTCRLLAEYHAKNGNPGLANYYRMVGSRDSNSNSETGSVPK